ncbi:MAG: hypothetical protein EAX86_01800 [Candidatus Heimdallarchaeota archaeon]|nr:hypothetical protein [Candidatus Heimdallarchaeota archaeon]
MENHSLSSPFLGIEQGLLTFVDFRSKDLYPYSNFKGREFREEKEDINSSQVIIVFFLQK